MTDTSIFRIDNMPISETPIEIKGLKNVKISVEPLAATKPFVHKGANKMKKKTIDERLKEGVNLPSMDELEDDFAKNLGIGLIFLVVFVVVLLVVLR